MRWLIDVTPCVAAQWRFKAALSAGLTLLFCVPYFTLQHVVLFPVRTLTPTPIDAAVAFDPRWVWAYQSVYLFISLVPWLASSRADLVHYARGFIALSCTGFVCFLVFPVSGPRPEVVPDTGMFAWLVWYDRPTNTIPSLHVGLAAYTWSFGSRVSRGRAAAQWRAALLAAGALWVAAIAYAALATKQHYAIDLPAGLMTAWLAHWWTWRDVTVLESAAAVVEAPAVGEHGR